MYITAQHVRGADGTHEVHAFLHAHDSEEWPFPEDAADVATKAVGRLVASCPTEEDRKVKIGGNEVLSFVDIAVRDMLWSTAWHDRLSNLKEQIRQAETRRGAWALGPLYVFFTSTESTVEPSTEFASLVAACAPLLDRAVELSDRAWRNR